MKTSKIFLISYFILIICFCLYLFNPFLLTMSIGILMAVSTSNIYTKILHFTCGKKTLSAILVTLLLCLLFLVPFIYAVIEISKNAANFDIKNITNTLNYIKNYHFNLPDFLSFLEPKIKELIASADIKTLMSKVLKTLTSIGKSSANFATDMGFIIVFYFFANLYASELFSYVKKSVPMNTKELEFILSEVANTTSVVFYSTILNAMIQGFCFGIIATFYGYDGILMGILFSFASLIPIVGGALVYVPVSIFEFANSNVFGAISILLFSVIFISMIVDNFFKPQIIKFINKKLVKNPTKINEMLIFFAMIAGISTFGIWGMILGPAIITFFISSVKVYISISHKNE